MQCSWDTPLLIHFHISIFRWKHWASVSFKRMQKTQIMFRIGDLIKPKTNTQINKNVRIVTCQMECPVLGNRKQFSIVILHPLWHLFILGYHFKDVCITVLEDRGVSLLGEAAAISPDQGNNRSFWGKCQAYLLATFLQDVGFSNLGVPRVEHKHIHVDLPCVALVQGHGNLSGPQAKAARSAVRNKLFCLWPRSFLRFVSIYKTVAS